MKVLEENIEKYFNTFVMGDFLNNKRCYKEKGWQIWPHTDIKHIYYTNNKDKKQMERNICNM